MCVILKLEISSLLQESYTHKCQVHANSPVIQIREALLSLL